MPPDSKPIAPRTKSERQAYIEGWVDCILDVQERGLLAAKQWLRAMVEGELR